MKFVEGGQLDEVVKREPMPIRRAVELIAKLARTVHTRMNTAFCIVTSTRDVLLDQNGEPHLTDFGLARLLETESTITRTLEVMGTPATWRRNKLPVKLQNLTRRRISMDLARCSTNCSLAIHLLPEEQAGNYPVTVGH